VGGGGSDEVGWCCAIEGAPLLRGAAEHALPLLAAAPLCVHLLPLNVCHTRWRIDQHRLCSKRRQQNALPRARVHAGHHQASNTNETTDTADNPRAGTVLLSESAATRPPTVARSAVKAAHLEELHHGSCLLKNYTKRQRGRGGHAREPLRTALRLLGCRPYFGFALHRGRGSVVVRLSGYCFSALVRAVGRYGARAFQVNADEWGVRTWGGRAGIALLDLLVPTQNRPSCTLPSLHKP
jgi:hypothetical protein